MPLHVGRPPYRYIANNKEPEQRVAIMRLNLGEPKNTKTEKKKNKKYAADKMKVKIKQWNGVASWLWVANDENCGICRAPFNGCCPDCKVPGDDCPLVWGQCSHCFHMHCILKWLNSQQVQQQCPMCRQEWKFKEGDTS
ncbi:anaphase-promoting complex subunit 11 [Triplophysa dalaica]|uniref:anaphase-promoting complex subunit 11 n=1 Tax=Triplophysa dalaica TaxID=1582913 RepID=UPI0024E00CBC|nr:anaphase-promoting complex subunit 11 [Triplophysa dalaica]